MRSLLEKDPEARPSSASEVLERLAPLRPADGQRLAGIGAELVPRRRSRHERDPSRLARWGCTDDGEHAPVGARAAAQRYDRAPRGGDRAARDVDAAGDPPRRCALASGGAGDGASSWAPGRGERRCAAGSGGRASGALRGPHARTRSGRARVAVRRRRRGAVAASRREDAAIVRRSASSAGEGIGGFTTRGGGRGRGVGAPTECRGDGRRRSGALEWREAVLMVRLVARALAACEEGLAVAGSTAPRVDLRGARRMGPRGRSRRGDRRCGRGGGALPVRTLGAPRASGGSAVGCGGEPIRARSRGIPR